MKTAVIRFPGSNCDRDIADILSKEYYHFQEKTKEEIENGMIQALV